VLMQRLDKNSGSRINWTRQMLARRHSNVVACASQQIRTNRMGDRCAQHNVRCWSQPCWHNVLHMPTPKLCQLVLRPLTPDNVNGIITLKGV
jgi:hypothetical protein